jgi:hypothetical protein
VYVTASSHPDRVERRFTATDPRVFAEGILGLSHVDYALVSPMILELTGGAQGAEAASAYCVVDTLAKAFSTSFVFVSVDSKVTISGGNSASSRVIRKIGPGDFEIIKTDV